MTEHARRQAARRGIAEATVLDVATAPEQTLAVRRGREVRQSRVTLADAACRLVRVVVETVGGRHEDRHRVWDEQVGEVLESLMKVEYDNETDTLTVILRSGAVAESDEDKPGVILDYHAAGNLLSIEVLDASRRVEDPRAVTFSLSGQTAG